MSFPVLFAQRSPRPFTAPQQPPELHGCRCAWRCGAEPPPAPRSATGRGPQPFALPAAARRPPQSEPLQGCPAPLPPEGPRQGGAAAEDASTGGPAGSWQAVHGQLSEWISAGLPPQLLKKGKEQGIHTALGAGNGSPSTLAWRIPWMEEPGGLRSVGSHRVGHD